MVNDITLLSTQHSGEECGIHTQGYQMASALLYHHFTRTAVWLVYMVMDTAMFIKK